MNGENAPDEIGTDCDNLDDAKNLAVTAAADMIRDLARAGWTGGHWEMRVADGDQTRFVLAFKSRDL